MDEDLPVNNQKFRFIAMGLLLVGIFVLAVGGGMFYLANEGKGDIRIISANAPDDISLADIKAGKIAGVAVRLINVNLASRDDLIALPGIGEVTADKIIAGRPYVTVDELLTGKVVNKGVFAKIRDLVSVDESQSQSEQSRRRQDFGGQAK